MPMSTMTATSINSINTSATSKKQELYNKLMLQVSFQNMKEEDRQAMVETMMQTMGLEQKENTPESLENKQKEQIQNTIDSERKKYQTASPAEKKAIINKHIKSLVERGVIVNKLSHKNIISQGVEASITKPIKTQTPQEKQNMLQSLMDQFNDTNTTTRVDEKLTDFKVIDTQSEKGTIKLRYDFRKMIDYHRTKERIQIMNNKSAEEAVLRIMSMQRKRMGGKRIGQPISRKFIQMKQFFKGKDAEDIKKTLQEKFDTFFKPMIDNLNSSGIQSDKELATQLQNKFNTIKQAYGANQVQMSTWLNL